MLGYRTVVEEYSVRAVTLEVLEHLERRRPAIAHDESLVRVEVRNALDAKRREYRESELPTAYFDALADEVSASVPARWRAVAHPFTEIEKHDFLLWRGGDVVARLVYVFVGLAVGGFCVWAPFIPIWEKWFPFLLALASWWLPSAQVAYQRRRYARLLGNIVSQLERAQPQLDRRMSDAELFLPPGGEK
jgi:hypothetical protein